jgi:signal transduction histidine kinase
MDPVAAVTRTAEAIYQRGDLSRRIAVGGGADELSTLGRTFNRMLDHIEQSVNAQRRFIGDASHELKTPLTVVRGNAELLARDPGGKDSQQAAAAILREATRMQRIVDDLMAIAELDAAPEMRLAPLDLRQLVRRVTRELAQLAGERRLRVSGTGPAWVVGDGDRLEHAVRNLVQNAITATEPAGRIEVDVTAAGAAVSLRVADDGPGIPPEHQLHVFERFYRVDKARSRAGGGTGLGLTIVRSVVEAHSGTVTAGSADLGGAEIELCLPAAPSPHAPAASAAPSAPWPERS